MMIIPDVTMLNDNHSPNSNDFIIDVSGNANIPIHFENDFSIPTNDSISHQNTSYDSDFCKIGKRYSRKLNLADHQVKMLDKMSFSGNVFNEIEYCKIQILKQFLRTINYLYQHCTPINKSYPTVIDELSEIIVCLRYNYKKESLNYSYTYDSVQTEIFNHILKLCENNIREIYGIKRRINTDFNYNEPDIFHQYNKKIVSKIESFLVENQYQILDADYKTNIILNENNTSRWKAKFDLIKQDYSNPLAFEREIFRLVEVNVKNPSVDTIFFEASKFVADYDRTCALRLYIHYLEKDLSSPKFDHRQFNKSIQKNLFSTQEQLTDFEEILKNFIADRDLEIAIKRANMLYQPKRKRITIDPEAIKDIQAQHSETADILGQILSDEEEENCIEREETVGKQELIIKITPQVSENQNTKYLDGLSLTDIQKEILDLFKKNSFNILQSDFGDFIKTKGLFIGSTIDSINECCFETLDDILIEEEDEYFIINTNYYQKLLNND
ncbi:tellurite resistance TerB C-terminal domain-containing protein [Chryseobacterium sp. SIMBA_028]|uniref:tellurite resistance TerB C-terminal domain-containing protein n=1 Tax=Chryseobacterium sp. SIMBA_028 TaxID=3085771 RepID=UPI00397883A9